MLAWMGGKRSKLKHAKKHHNSKPRLNSSSTTIAEAGSKRPLSPANRTRGRPGKCTKRESHQHLRSGAGSQGREPAEWGEASASSSSLDLQNVATGVPLPIIVDQQAANGGLAHLSGNVVKIDGTRPKKSLVLKQGSWAVDKPQGSRKGNVARTGGSPKMHQAAVSLDIQGIELPM